MTWGRKPTCTCGECAKCKHRARSREWYQRQTIEQRRELIARRTTEDKRTRADRIAADPEFAEKERTRQRTRRALGTGQPCEVCGDPGQWHHEDYGAPYDVISLCPVHHAERHAEVV